MIGGASPALHLACACPRLGARHAGLRRALTVARRAPVRLQASLCAGGPTLAELVPSIQRLHPLDSSAPQWHRYHTLLSGGAWHARARVSRPSWPWGRRAGRNCAAVPGMRSPALDPHAAPPEPQTRPVSGSHRGMGSQFSACPWGARRRAPQGSGQLLARRRAREAIELPDSRPALHPSSMAARG